MKQKMISDKIGFHSSTISTALSRNILERSRTDGEYVVENAQLKTNQRHHLKPKVVNFTHSMKKQAVKWIDCKK
jgi:IS30 family transposase